MEEKFALGKIAFILQITILTGDSVNIPRVSIGAAGTGAWSIILFDTLVSLIISYIFIHLGFKYENCTIYEYSEKLTGKIFSKLLVLLYILFFLLEFVYISQNLSYVIKSYYLLKTPLWFILLLVSFTTIFILLRGFNTLSKSCIVYVVLAYTSILFVVVLGLKKVNVLNLYPLFDTTLLGKYGKACFTLMNYFMGIQILSVIPFKYKMNSKKAFKYVTISIIMAGFIFILFTQLSLGILGEVTVSRYREPILVVSRNAEAGFAGAKGRIDGILIIGYIVFLIGAISANLYAASTLTKKIFTKLPTKFIIIFIVISSFVGSFIPRTPEKFFIIKQYENYIGILTLLFIPIILLIISKFKKVNL